MSLNNIDTKQVKEYKKEIQADPKQAKFTARIEGDWLFEEGGPQFRSTVKVKDGTYTMESSHPNFAGPGSRPGGGRAASSCRASDPACFSSGTRTGRHSGGSGGGQRPADLAGPG